MCEIKMYKFRKAFLWGNAEISRVNQDAENNL